MPANPSACSITTRRRIELGADEKHAHMYDDVEIPDARDV